MKMDHNFEMMFDDNIFTSVFNCNKNEIERTYQAFQMLFGFKEVKKLKDFIKKQGGIMAIFNESDKYDETKDKTPDKLVLFALMLSQVMLKRKKDIAKI